MRRFKTLCIDNETNNYMVFADCSFNAAAFQLEFEIGEPTEVKTIDSRFTKIEYPGRTFIYDEHRGLLMERR